MGDIDLRTFSLITKSKLALKAVDAITGASVRRTIEGASTLSISLDDSDFEILNSGLLSNRLDVEVDGLWFRLAQVRLNGTSLELTFEDREVALLRTYSKKLGPLSRTQNTRAEFVLKMLQEVKEVNIPYYIPHLHRVQRVEQDESAAQSTYDPATDTAGATAQGGDTTRDQGIAQDHGASSAVTRVVRRPISAGGAGQSTAVDYTSVTAPGRLTVKGAPITPAQISVANTVLSVGVSMGVRRKVLVVGMMVGIVESQLRNLPGGDADSVGVFQQRDSWGSWNDRHDVATSARMFFDAAIKQDILEPTVPEWVLAADIQRPREDLRTEYDKWFMEGERLVTEYGFPSGSMVSANGSTGAFGASGGDYQFYRGEPPTQGKTGWKPENSWNCVQRLAEEVAWRAFFVSGTFYFLSESALFSSKPRAIIDHQTPGVDSIDFDYDSGKKSATCEIRAHVKRWAAPPGTVIQLTHMGPVNGRWLVSDFERSLYDDMATISLKKPRPTLPEPTSNNVAAATGSTFATQPGRVEEVLPGDRVAAFPSGNGWGMDSVISTAKQHHERALGNWESDDAYDIKTAPGTPVLAVESGVIGRVNLNHQGEHGGNIFGAQIHLTGDSGVSWFYTHIEEVTLASGTRVRAGQQIARVTVWDAGDTHLHLGTTNVPALEQLLTTGRQVK